MTAWPAHCTRVPLPSHTTRRRIASQVTNNGSQANFSDPVWAWRDHDGGANGITLIRTMVGAHYPAPASDLYIRDWLWMSQVRTTHAHCYLAAHRHPHTQPRLEAFRVHSQIAHAMCHKIETEHYRSIRSECSATQYGCTMGALYS